LRSASLKKINCLIKKKTLGRKVGAKIVKQIRGAKISRYCLFNEELFVPGIGSSAMFLPLLLEFRLEYLGPSLAGQPRSFQAHFAHLHIVLGIRRKKIVQD
jgi:hypothetical protein